MKASASDCSFQFTLPCRERRLDDAGPFSDPEFQFTLPCRERQVDADEAKTFLPVSIHAPV